MQSGWQKERRNIKDTALLVFGLMWNIEYYHNLQKVVEHLKHRYGQLVLETPDFVLKYSSYYQREMGSSLVKRFVALDCLVHKQMAVQIKKDSISLEDDYRAEGRTVNIDPVLVDEYQVVALSKKDRGSRIYLSDGVYAEMELFYHHRAFHPFLWTYIDYKENILFFERVRKLYLEKMRLS